jgi:hypothetical protein
MFDNILDRLFKHLWQDTLPIYALRDNHTNEINVGLNEADGGTPFIQMTNIHKALYIMDRVIGYET